MNWKRWAPWMVGLAFLVAMVYIILEFTKPLWATHKGTETACPPRAAYDNCLLAHAHGELEPVNLAFSSDGALLASAASGIIKLWRVADGSRAFEIRNFPTIQGMALTPDGQSLIAVNGTSIKVWRLADQEITQTITLEGFLPITHMALSAGGRLVGTSTDFNLALWRLEDGTQLHSLKSGRIKIQALAFSPDGALLAVARSNGPVEVFDVLTGELALSLPHEEVNDLAFTPDGTLLATGGTDRDIRLWRVADGALAQTLVGHGYNVLALTISPDGRRLASASREGVKIWSLPEGGLLETLFNVEILSDLAFSPDGKLLAVPAEERTIRLWRLP